MPDDRPTAAELVDAVTEFLERDLQPSLEGRLAFHTRVAVNALRIVHREMELGPELDAARRAGLRELLGSAAGDASTRDLEAELARRIRDGAFDDRRPELVAYLRATLRLQLDIVHPGYERQEAS
ncbi:MAG: hypothetical protein QOF28_2088, partial [Actinomycetota bacterium]|nr:hypothetical protein [Actinomycetota bacterium]